MKSISKLITILCGALLLSSSVYAGQSPSKQFLDLKIEAMNGKQEVVNFTVGQLYKLYTQKKENKISWEKLGKNEWDFRIDIPYKPGLKQQVDWIFKKDGKYATYSLVVNNKQVSQTTALNAMLPPANAIGKKAPKKPKTYAKSKPPKELLNGKINGNWQAKGSITVQQYFNFVSKKGAAQWSKEKGAYLIVLNNSKKKVWPTLQIYFEKQSAGNYVPKIFDEKGENHFNKEMDWTVAAIKSAKKRGVAGK